MIGAENLFASFRYIEVDMYFVFGILKLVSLLSHVEKKISFPS
jgi:hypothetical protein